MVNYPLLYSVNKLLYLGYVCRLTIQRDQYTSTVTPDSKIEASNKTYHATQGRVVTTTYRE